MFSLENIIFKLFGVEDKVNDINKDVNNQGTYERFHRSLGEDYDEEIQPLIDDFISNTINPQTALEKFVPYIEVMMGSIPIIKDDITTRRKVLEFATRIYKVKGTALSYKMVFVLLGYETVTITEHIESFGLDSSVTLDDDVRVFDRSCPPCTEYTLEIDGPGVPLTNAIIETIFKLIDFVEPIDAKTRSVFVNGVEIFYGIIEVQIIDGVLYYDNSQAPEVQLFLLNGILYINEEQASFYTIIDGLLYYVT